MNKAETRKIAEEYVLKHKRHYQKGRRPGGVTNQEIRSAVDRIAKVLHGLKIPHSNENERAA